MKVTSVEGADVFTSISSSIMGISLTKIPSNLKIACQIEID